MSTRKEQICRNVDKYREITLAAERWLWQHPETGYTEWQGNDYLIQRFEELGYTPVRADQDPNHGKIPGFYTDVDTGRPGPFLCIMGEMDALDISNHPESVNGMTHCCGHHAQAAAMLAVAGALTEPGALDGLCGKIRLMLVPAEEMIQLSFREELRQKGIIKYNGGKPEFMYRGYFDGIDLCLMVHGTSGEKSDLSCGYGNNGCMAKVITYRGKSSHAGGAPQNGINAQYAAMLGLQACNDLRETFPDDDHIRFHPIMKGVNCAVNIIPDEMVIESYVRGRSLEAMKRENIKINRALTGAALAMGARVELCDRPGYAPEAHDRAFMQLVEDCCCQLVGRERVDFDYHSWSTGSSDFGDLTCVMPGVQWNCAGASGHAHGIDYQIVDPEKITLLSAKSQLLVAEALLENGGEKAREIVRNYQPAFGSIKEYLDAIEDFSMIKNAVVYQEDGSVTIDYQR